jgi:hypothetical protein
MFTLTKSKQPRQFIERGDRHHRLRRAGQHGQATARARSPPRADDRWTVEALRFEALRVSDCSRLWWPKAGGSARAPGTARSGRPCRTRVIARMMWLTPISTRPPPRAACRDVPSSRTSTGSEATRGRPPGRRARGLPNGPRSDVAQTGRQRNLAAGTANAAFAPRPPAGPDRRPTASAHCGHNRRLARARWRARCRSSSSADS